MGQGSQFRLFLVLLVAVSLCWAANDDPVVFKSDVAMTRVDAQVVDRDGRAITGLGLRDFILRLDGHVVPIRNLASENMPIDILLLLDVSGSMRPHVERIADAAQQALNVLAENDRVAIMIFDTYTRVRLPFRNSHREVTSELNHLLRSEGFNGGTRITHAMIEAANYLSREARPEARRAIVILTDDQTQDEEDQARVDAALARANAVLSFLQAPYEIPGINGGGGGRPHGTWGGSGSGGLGLPGGIGFPGGGPIGIGGRRRGGGGYGGQDMSHTAGTADIAKDSGGDTMRVDEASALEDTLARLRQRYALYFYLPESARSADQQNLRIDLSEETRIRFQQAELHYRRVHMSGSNSNASSTPERSDPMVTSVQKRADTSVPSIILRDESGEKRRRVAVNDDSTTTVNTVADEAGPAAVSSPQAIPAAPPPQAAPPKSGGWPRASQTPPH